MLTYSWVWAKEIQFNTENKHCNYIYVNNVRQNNIFEILINSNNQLLVEGSINFDISHLKDGVTKFMNNNGADPESSDNPESAFLFIQSEGSKTIDYEIISIINTVYAEINIEINERKICHLRDNVLEEWRRINPPPPPPSPISH